MQHWHFRKQGQRGNFSLSALLLVTCLLVLMNGPFHAALSYLRADQALHRHRRFQQYLNHGTHLVRREATIGTGQLDIENETMAYQWFQVQHAELSSHMIFVTPDSDVGWPSITSQWIDVADVQFEIRGRKPSP